MFILSESEVNQVINAMNPNVFMDSLICEIENGFRTMEESGIKHSRRAGFEREIDLVEWMPVTDDVENFTIKIVSYFPQNPTSIGTPTISAVIVMFDLMTGKPKAIIDGTLLTAMRTGAASAVASRFLANPNAKVLGLVGGGVQAITQAHALSRVFSFEEILVYDIEESVSETVTNRLAFLGLNVRTTSVSEIERESDIISTATTTPVGSGPVIKGGNLKADVHINAVGADFPGKTELPRDLVWSSFIVTDFYEQAIREGECQIFSGKRRNSVNCVELKSIARNHEVYAEHCYRRTVFDSTGIAMEDAIAARLVWEAAKQQSLGRNIENIVDDLDAQDPYASLHCLKVVS